MRGQEQERESGAVPLAGAVVAVQWTDAGRRPARRSTNSRFGGSATLLRYPILMSPGITREVAVRLVPEPVEMEPLVAVAERSRRPEIKGSYEWMKVAIPHLNTVVLPIEVGAVEVYRGPASLPARFSGPDSRCGVVAIWTK